MVLLGLPLTAASGAFVALPIADNLSGVPGYPVTILGTNLVVLNSLGILLSGVALALLFCLGLAMIGLSWRAPRRSRRAGTPVERSAQGGSGRPENRPVAPMEPRHSAPAERAVGGSDEMRVPPEERAAEQGGRERGARPVGRIRHLLGH
ncbi:hypothetical protein ACFU7Y_25800 [Kitasatospora sp. NPDC057542]|uniref:hypothetical protein n=1 Tax=Streptomycetaceae TaxID=2062 RepID=UPI001CCDCF83|nr:hypothetical protein [Streptomyces sp. LS1784]